VQRSATQRGTFFSFVVGVFRRGGRREAVVLDIPRLIGVTDRRKERKNYVAIRLRATVTRDFMDKKKLRVTQVLPCSVH
jgi:hypothetical protein